MNSLTIDFFRNYLFSKRAGALIRRISWLSVSGLFLSVAALVIVISVMTALNKTIRDRTLALEPHLTVQFSSATPISFVENHPLTLKLKAIDGVEVQTFETQDVILRSQDGRFRGAVARGVSDTSYRKFLAEINKDDQDPMGSLANKEGEGPLLGEVDVGIDLARSLDLFEGDSLMVVPPEGLLLPPTETPPFERLKVRRIVSTQLADWDSTVVFYKQGLALRSFRQTASRRLGLEVWTKNPDNVEALKKQLSEFPEVKVETWKERNSALFFALRMEKTVMTIFLSLASLVAGFSLITVLALLVSQKKREIGLMRALGFSNKGLQSLFMKLGMGLALVGVGGGFLIGLIVSLYLQFFPLDLSRVTQIYYDAKIPAQVDFGFLLSLLAVSFAMTFLGARFASKEAAKETPSENLRSQV